jgi:hypothetical protein
MKSIVLLLVVLTLAAAQTRWPSPLRFVYGNASVLLDSAWTAAVSPQTFTIGWHWGFEKHVSRAVGANQIHTTITLDGDLDTGYVGRDGVWLPDSVRIIMNHALFNGKDCAISFNSGMIWEPTYRVDSLDPTGRFHPRPGDTLGYAFGFRHVRGFIPAFPSHPHYSRLLLYPSLFPAGTDTLVLAAPWMDNTLARTNTELWHMLPNDSTHASYWNAPDTVKYHGAEYQWESRSIYGISSRRDFYGVRFYFLINLRRLGATDTLMTNDTVLTIRLPYQMWPRSDGSRQQGYVRFSWVPATSQDSVYWLPPIRGTGQSRGLVRKMDSIPSTRAHPIEFAITRAMLPRGDDADPDITLMAQMEFDGRTLDSATGLPKNNPILKYFKAVHDPIRTFDTPWGRADAIGYGDSTMIDRIGIEVRYRPASQCSVGIDWVGIVTPETWKLIAGYHYSLVVATMQHILDGISAPGSIMQRKHIRPYRIDVADEAQPVTWLARWYLSRLVGRIFTSEDAATSLQFKYYLKPNEYWSGMPQAVGYVAWYTNPKRCTFTDTCAGCDSTVWDGYRYFCCAPGELDDYSTVCSSILEYHRQRCFLPYGYNVEFNNPEVSDTQRREWMARAHYETALFNNRPFNFFRDSAISPMRYQDYSNAPAAHIERRDFDVFYAPVYPWHPPSFLFDTVPWWGQLWIDPHFRYRRAYPSDSTPPRRYSRLLVCTHDSHLPTGEQLRSQMWRIVLYGGKGLIFDGSADVRPFIHSLGIPDSLLTEYHYYLIMRAAATHHILRRLYGDTFSDTMTPYQLRDTTIMGSDFLDTRESPGDTVLTHYLDVNVTPGMLNLPPHRFYLGRRSWRREIGRIGDWARAFGDTLFRLRLQAAMMKGYQKFFISREGRTAGPLWRYIDTTGLWTRRIGETRYENWSVATVGNPPDQSRQVPVDSSFYHVVLHFEEGRSPDTVFYLGVLNTRTAPHVLADSVRDPRTGEPYRLGAWDTLPVRFYSTYEFDTLSARGYVGRYAQLGAREITIPFHFRPTTDVVAWLRVREIGGTLDTIIGASEPLAVKYLPGEGKLFRVEVIYDSPLSGELAHSNQRKLVGVPISADGKLMVYHLVYHRRVLDPICGSERTKVFYRRSRPVWVPGGMISNITWEPEVVLSERFAVIPDSIRCNSTDTSGIAQLSSCMDCGYPSIVVRSQGETPMVYVVFGCRKPNLTGSSDAILIAEVMFPAQGAIGSPVAAVLDVFSVSPGSDSNLARWGTPTVNAAYHGNYYAWPNAETQSLVVAFKRPGQRYLHICDYAVASNQGGQPFHPALNTYSRIAQREQDCALVWEQGGQIYYTRLRADTATRSFAIGGLLYSLTAPLCLSRDNSIPCSIENRFPIVYRGIEDHAITQRVELMRHAQDRIAWEGVHLGDTGLRRRVYYRKVDLEDVFPGGDTQAVKQPLRYALSPLSTFVALGRNVGQPTLAQGKLVLDTLRHGWRNASDSALVFGLTEFWGTAPRDTSLLWQVLLNLWVQASRGNVPTSRQQQLERRGQLGHLAAIPAVTIPTLLHTTRRVHQARSWAGGTHIVTNSQYLYRWNPADEPEIMGFIGTDEEVTRAVSMLPGPPQPCTFYDVILPLPPPWCCPIAPPLIAPSTGDTARTAWFPIEDSITLLMAVLGSDTLHARMELVRQSDGMRFSVPLVPAPDTAAIIAERVFINGGGETYRLEFFARSGGSISEKYYLGALPTVNDTAPDRRAIGRGWEPFRERTVIDLGRMGTTSLSELELFPLPADAQLVVRIRSSSPEVYHVRLVSLLGTELAHGVCRSGQEVVFSTTQVANGVYVLRAHASSGNILQRLAVIHR